MRPFPNVARALLATGVAAVTLSACAVNPATGNREFSLVSEAQEIQMGRQSDPAIVAEMGLYPDSAVQRYVRGLGLEMAARSERPDLPWTFRVLDDPSVNAFALPGGFVYVTRGILTHLTSEAELVGVLGHEIGHVTARHSASQVSRAQLAQLGLGLGMIFSERFRQYGGLAAQSLGLLFLKFGRDDELQADQLGVRYMTRVGYDPRQLASVMDMLGRTATLGGGGRAPEWASTHPDPVNRTAAIMQEVSRGGYSGATRVDRDGYLRRLDGMPFGPDPREGFVEDGIFHHPDLAFRLEAAGWEVANGKSEVQFVAPDGGSAVILTLEQESPGDAARAFAGLDGVSVGSARGTRVNGFDGVRLPFRAQTQDGVLEGEVLWLAYAGRTYRLLGLASQSGWRAASSRVVALQQSFQRETDRRVLSIRGPAVEVVSLGSPQSFEAFMRGYPSTVSGPVVALINQVDQGQTLSRGLWKRVAARN